MPSREPTHIHDQGAKTTRCGRDMRYKACLPYVRAEHVQAHIDGYGMVVCEACRG